MVTSSSKARREVDVLGVWFWWWLCSCGSSSIDGGGLGSESRKDLGDNETGESRRHCLSGSSNQWGGRGGGFAVLIGVRAGCWLGWCGLRGRSRLAPAVVLASLACLEEAVERVRTGRRGRRCVELCEDEADGCAASKARELSSEGGRERTERTSSVRLEIASFAGAGAGTGTGTGTGTGSWRNWAESNV